MTDNNSNVEVLPPSAVASLERAAIDCQVATAHAYPRSLEIFKKRALGMATLDLETAESCIYSRPVGGGKVAEGASIRMAEIVAASYGNLRVASRIIEQTPRYVKCEGVAHDLESNYAGKSECVEPTVKQNGDPYSESQRAVVAKACLAKAYRDAVFKVVPKAMCKAIINAAKGVINKEVATIEQRRDRAKQWLKQVKVDEARAFAVFGVKGWSEVTDDHLTTLTGLKTAINEQDTTIDEAFPQIAKAPSFGPGDAPRSTTPATAPAPQQSAPKTAPVHETPVGDPPQTQEQPKTQETTKAPGDDGDLGPATQPPSEEVTSLVTQVIGFTKLEGETDDAAYLRLVELVRTLAEKSGVAEKQVLAHGIKEKFVKSGQKLNELTASKLISIGKAWLNILPKIRLEKAE